jgi:hypothetical protein
MQSFGIQTSLPLYLLWLVIPYTPFLESGSACNYRFLLCMTTYTPGT